MRARSHTPCPFAVALLMVGALVVGGGCNGAAPDRAPVDGPEAAVGERVGELFTDVTAAAGLGGFRHETGAFGEKWFPESMGSGGGFIDFDGDGWLDVLLLGGGTWPGRGVEPVPAVALYRNNGDGTFALRTAEAGLDGIDAYTLGLAVADYDNDGDDDLYLTNLTENLLFRNDGGAFTDVTAEAGVGGDAVWSTSTLFFDADRDGRLDLFVGNYVHWSPEKDIFCTLYGEQKDYCTPQIYESVASRFYRNNGDGTFADRTEAAGFATGGGKTLGVAELDVNRDGWPDLAVANDTDPDQLYVNDGSGRFVEQGAVSGIAYDEQGRARAGMGIDAGIVDRTGEVSLFVGNFSREMIGVYRHLGNGLFIDRAAVSQIGRPSLLTLTFGLFLFDADLDGDLDLFAANGHVQPDIEKVLESVHYAEPPHLFLNDGDGTFHDVAPEADGALREALVARGAAYGDVDRDGDLDILLTENGRGARLWRNNLDAGRFLRVHAEGTVSNRSGLGARIVAVAGSDRMERRVRSGSSYLSASEHAVTFGLGSRAGVDSLLVFWPSGRTDRFGPVEGGREVRVVEGSGALVPVARAASAPVAARRP